MCGWVHGWMHIQYLEPLVVAVARIDQVAHRQLAPPPGEVWVDLDGLHAAAAAIVSSAAGGLVGSALLMLLLLLMRLGEGGGSV